MLGWRRSRGPSRGGANTWLHPAATPTRDSCMRPPPFAISYRLGHVVPGGEDDPRRVFRRSETLHLWTPGPLQYARPVFRLLCSLPKLTLSVRLSNEFLFPRPLLPRLLFIQTLGPATRLARLSPFTSPLPVQRWTGSQLTADCLI